MSLKIFSEKISNINEKLVLIEDNIDTINILADEALKQQDEVIQNLQTLLGDSKTSNPNSDGLEASGRDLEAVPDEISTKEKFDSFLPLLHEKLLERAEYTSSDEIEKLMKSISQAKYDQNGLFINEFSKQGQLSDSELKVWAEIADGIDEFKNLSSSEVEDIDENKLQESIETVLNDDESQQSVDALLEELETLENAHSDNLSLDEDLDSLLEGME